MDEIGFTFSIIRKHRSISGPVEGREQTAEKNEVYSSSAYVGDTGERK